MYACAVFFAFFEARPEHTIIIIIVQSYIYISVIKIRIILHFSSKLHLNKNYRSNAHFEIFLL